MVQSEFQPSRPRTSAKVPLEEILVQGDAFFRGESPMHFAASKLAKKLRELGFTFAHPELAEALRDALGNGG